MKKKIKYNVTILQIRKKNLIIKILLKIVIKFLSSYFPKQTSIYIKSFGNAPQN